MYALITDGSIAKYLRGNRGLTIGAIEGLTAGLAGAGTTAVLRTGSGFGTKVAAIVGGTSIEAVGGGLGEVGGRLAADQEMDPAEIGFEAITGTVTAPGSVGLSLLTFKPATYKLNNEIVSFEEMKDFVETATDMQIATANISMENDLSGLDVEANKKQINAIIDNSIDGKVTDINDRKKLVELEKENFKFILKGKSWKR